MRYLIVLTVMVVILLNVTIAQRPNVIIINDFNCRNNAKSAIEYMDCYEQASRATTTYFSLDNDNYSDFDTFVYNSAIHELNNLLWLIITYRIDNGQNERILSNYLKKELDNYSDDSVNRGEILITNSDEFVANSDKHRKLTNIIYDKLAQLVNEIIELKPANMYDRIFVNGITTSYSAYKYEGIPTMSDLDNVKSRLLKSGAIPIENVKKMIYTANSKSLLYNAEDEFLSYYKDFDWYEERIKKASLEVLELDPSFAIPCYKGYIDYDWGREMMNAAIEERPFNEKYFFRKYLILGAILINVALIFYLMYLAAHKPKQSIQS